MTEEMSGLCQHDVSIKEFLRRFPVGGGSVGDDVCGVAANFSSSYVCSIMRLAFAEFSKRVSAAAIDLYGIDAPEVIGSHAWGHDYLDAFSETIAGGTAEIQRNIIAERVLGLPKGPR